MRLLIQKILSEGKVLEGNILKVDSFLNHMIDVTFAEKMGREFYKRFKGKNVTKILTVEASGIGLSCLTAKKFNCPVLFAKKSNTLNLSNDVYSAEVFSFTHNIKTIIRVCKDYLKPSDNVLIIDDFMANGEAVRGLIEIIRQAGATLVGVGIAIEKGFQGGADELRAKGIDVYSLAIIEKMGTDGIEFRKK